MTGGFQPKASWYANRVEKILRYFTKLDVAEQQEYAGELARLLEPGRTTVGGLLTITVTIGGESGYVLGGQFLEAAEIAGWRRTTQ